MKILLDYVFPISVITPTPAPSTAFLRQACVVAKPKLGQEGKVGELIPCLSMTEVAAVTDNLNAQELFDAGMNRVLVLLAEDLDLGNFMEDHRGEFFTVLISDDFDDNDIGLWEGGAAATGTAEGITFTARNEGALGNAIEVLIQDGSGPVSVFTPDHGHFPSDPVENSLYRLEITCEFGTATLGEIVAAVNNHVENEEVVASTDSPEAVFNPGSTVDLPLAGGVDAVLAGPALNVGGFEGVVGVSSYDLPTLKAQAVIGNRCAFHGSPAHGAKSMFRAFGRLLSTTPNWRNLQYIEMPYDDGIDSLGFANTLFEDRISFALQDDEFGNRLAFFAAGGKAIVAPYILKNLRVDMQGAALQWISLNQPSYTIVEASLLEGYLQERVIDSYVRRRWVAGGEVNITLEQQNFVADGHIEVPEPKALWRVVSEFRQTV